MEKKITTNPIWEETN